MDHLIEQCSGIANPSRLARKFDIVVVYETFVSAVRALRACELLRQEIPPDVTMRINAWRIGKLQDHTDRQLAASHASHSDLVIISSPGRDAPPPILHDWLDLWIDSDITSPPALFTLFGDHMTDSAAATAHALRRRAAPIGIDFFIHPAPDTTPASPQHSLGWKNNHLQRGTQPSKATTSRGNHESAFDTIESFAAHLRALFLDLSTADLPVENRAHVQAAL